MEVGAQDVTGGILMGSLPPCNALIEVAFRRQASLSQGMFVKRLEIFHLHRKEFGEERIHVTVVQETASGPSLVLLTGKDLSPAHSYIMLYLDFSYNTEKKYSC